MAADAKGPFERVSLRVEEREIPFDRWGDYFYRATVPASAKGETLWLSAERVSGAPLRAGLELVDR